MKATGIVRRIDDLGRVVNPKEIRRTQRIRPSDPLEIFTTSDGEVIFKKYSPVGELSDFAARYAEVLSRSLGLPVLVCDRDHTVAAAGPSRREFQERRVSRGLEQIMDSRRTYVWNGSEADRLWPCEGASRLLALACPIVAAGDVAGAVCVLGALPALPVTSDGVKAAELTAALLARQLEE